MRESLSDQLEQAFKSQIWMSSKGMIKLQKQEGVVAARVPLTSYNISGGGSGTSTSSGSSGGGGSTSSSAGSMKMYALFCSETEM